MYTPDLHITYGITASDLKGFSFNLNIAHTSEQDITDYEYGTWEKIEKDEFTVANLSISKKILDYNKCGSVTMKGEIQNLFDHNYEYVQGYPMSGRVFFVSLKYDF
jgi:vitamin B12 transporter